MKVSTSIGYGWIRWSITLAFRHLGPDEQRAVRLALDTARAHWPLIGLVLAVNLGAALFERSTMATLAVAF